MDEIEISIERGSSEWPQQSETPQISPRIAAGAAAVFILALVMWLGAQTPARTPITTTSEVVSPTEEWLVELEANPPEALSVLSAPVFLFVLDQNEIGWLVEISPREVTSTELICGAQTVRSVMGQMVVSLIVKSEEMTCWLSLDRPDEVVVIPGARSFGSFVPSGPNTGWFCDESAEAAWRIVEFEVESGLGAGFETSGCPSSAEGENLLLYDQLLSGCYLWTVGDPVVREAQRDRESCEVVNFSRTAEVCRVGAELEIRDYFLEDRITFPAMLSSDIIGRISISPDRSRLLLPIIDHQPQANPNPHFVVIDLGTGETTQVASPFLPSFGTWVSNGQILMIDNLLVGDCPTCSGGLSLFNVESGSGTRLQGRSVAG